MKKISKKKAKVAIVLGLLIIISSVFLFSLSNKSNEKIVKADEQGIVTYTKRDIVKDEIFDGIKYTNNLLITENNYTVFTSTVVNISDNDISKEKYHLYLKNKKGDIVKKLLIYIPHGLKKGESKNITATIGGEIEDAYSKVISE